MTESKNAKYGFGVFASGYGCHNSENPRHTDIFRGIQQSHFFNIYAARYSVDDCSVLRNTLAIPALPSQGDDDPFWHFPVLWPLAITPQTRKRVAPTAQRAKKPKPETTKLLARIALQHPVGKTPQLQRQTQPLRQIQQR